MKIQSKSIINITDNENVILGMDQEIYHSLPPISKSGLDLIAKSPAHFKAGFKKSTKSMDAGTLAHTAILEPGEFDNRYVLGPDVNKNTKMWKAFVDDHLPKITIDRKTYDTALKVRASVMNHQSAGPMFEGGLAEVSIFGEIEGIAVRCRPDYLINNYCIDLKKIKSADDRTIQQSIHNYRYHVSDAFYTDVLASAGIEIDGFILVFVEMEPPFGVSCKMLDATAIARGREVYQNNLNTFIECQKANLWPCYSEHIETIDIPGYSYWD